MRRTFIGTGLATLALAVFLPTDIRAQGCEECEEPPEPPPWEHIHDDYRNLRGFNFIPEYASLSSYKDEGVAPDPNATPPIIGEQFVGLATDYKGVASPTAMWCYYDMLPDFNLLPAGGSWSMVPNPSVDLSMQLDAVKGIGANTVRVWLSFPAWYDEHTPGISYNEFIENFNSFLSLCEARRLYVIPIIWDMVGAREPSEKQVLDPEWTPYPNYDPTEGPPYCDSTFLLQGWHSNPGDYYVWNYDGNGFDDPHFRDPVILLPETSDPRDPQLTAELYQKFELYIREVVRAGKDSPALIMWDAMNEPALVGGGKEEGVLLFLEETLKIIKEEDSDNDTLVGFQSVAPACDSGAIAWNDLDVVGTQLYSYTRIQAEAAVGAATQFAMSKPLIAVETGGQGLEQYALDYATLVDRTDLPKVLVDGELVFQKGMGFILFQAMVGLRKTNHPHLRETGLFFWNGNVRSENDATAIRDFSANELPPLPDPPLTPTFTQPAQFSIFGWQAPIHHDGVVEVNAYTQLQEHLGIPHSGTPYTDWSDDPLDPNFKTEGDIRRHWERYNLVWGVVTRGQKEKFAAAAEPITHLVANSYTGTPHYPGPILGYSTALFDFLDGVMDATLTPLGKYLNPDPDGPDMDPNHPDWLFWSERTAALQNASIWMGWALRSSDIKEYGTILY
jgi:hypothetical protein